MRLQYYPLPNNAKSHLYGAQCLSLNVFQLDKILIFWTFSTFIRDGSGQLRWILTYQRQPLDVIQSGIAVRDVTRLDMIWMKRFFSRASFFLSVRSGVVSSQFCLHETIDYSLSKYFMYITMKSYIIIVETSFRHMPITQLRSSLVGFCDSAYQHFSKFLLLVDVCFPVTL